MGYMLNPSAQIVAETHLALRIENNKIAHLEPIVSPTQMDGLYRLIAMDRNDFDAFMCDGMSQDHELVHALRAGYLLVSANECQDEPARSKYAFMVKHWEKMRLTAELAPTRFRDEVHIVDGVFPEAARFSIDIWVRTVPYRRIDIDTPHARDLHWTFTMSPPLDYVRSVPFLRAIDEKVRAVVSIRNLDLYRAYVYAGSSVDVYGVHRDSTLATDITAIYFPAPWQDHTGGELLFYDCGEPRWAVSPRANRLIAFHGSREHRVAPVSHTGGYSRYSIVLRYTATTFSEKRL